MAIKVSHQLGTAGSRVTVNLVGTATKATLFADEAETTPLANPVTVSPNGWVFFAVAQGDYDLVESGNGTDKDTLRVRPQLSGSPVRVPAVIPADGTVLAWDGPNERARGATPAAALTAPVAATFTATNVAVIDVMYTAEEAGVLENLRTRAAEQEAVIRNLVTRLNELEGHVRGHRLIS